MHDDALFDATVPVLRHYLQCIETLLAKLPEEHEPLLQERLTIHAFTASEHVQTAIGFVSRTVLPLLGREAAGAGHEALGRDGLIRLARETGTWLRTVSPKDFEGATRHVVSHTAGTAELRQDAILFATVFALPNFFFHFSMAFAILRQGGVPLGKEDFDGQHRYSAGFRFPACGEP